jgi:hypothetical protein
VCATLLPSLLRDITMINMIVLLVLIMPLSHVHPSSILNLTTPHHHPSERPCLPPLQGPGPLAQSPAQACARHSGSSWGADVVAIGTPYCVENAALRGSRPSQSHVWAHRHLGTQIYRWTERQTDTGRTCERVGLLPPFCPPFLLPPKARR